MIVLRDTVGKKDQRNQAAYILAQPASQPAS
jgi:hypothetical protein